MFLEIITHSDPVIRYGNATVEQRGYDGYGRLSRQTLTASNGQTLHQFSYRRDANGNLTQRHSGGLAQFPALTASYRYDELDRLRQERYDLTPALNADYTFDPNGNRLTRQQGVNGTEADEIYRYAAKSNRLLDKDALRQADALPEPVKDVTYDAKQRVRTLSVGGQLKAEYRYDARNLRTKKTLYDDAGAVSAEVYYHYDANGLLIGESDALGLVRREYVYLGMMPVAQIDIDSQGQESVVYFLTDQLATPRLGIDQGQAVVWKWESDAYGSIAPSGSVTVNLRFAGQYFDAESGWYYNWNRYYLPEEGRYLSSDPIGIAGSLNTYLYVDGNPLYYVDPLGLARVRYYSEAPDYVRQGIEENLAKLEQALSRLTKDCPLATERLMDLFDKWLIDVSSEPSKFHEGLTNGRSLYTTLPKGEGSLNDLAHEFYHLTPENINIGEQTPSAILLPPDQSVTETGSKGAINFANSLELEECLCKYYTGEALQPDPRLQNRPRQGLWDILKEALKEALSK